MVRHFFLYTHQKNNNMNKTIGQNKLWTGSFIKICLVNFFIFVNFHALLPTFPFFVTYLGGDALTIGVATALFSVASIASRPFSGWLVDTKGRCAVLTAGLIGMAAIPMGYFSLCHYPQNSTRIVPCSLKQCLLDMGCRHHTLRANGRRTRNVRTFNGTIDRNRTCTRIDDNEPMGI